jgi:hypothetical protein
MNERGEAAASPDRCGRPLRLPKHGIPDLSGHSPLVDDEIQEPPDHGAGRMPFVNHVLCGLAANPSLPPELVDRLVAVADTDVAAELAARADLGHAQAVALAARDEENAVQLAHEGRLTVADIDPVTQPHAALTLLQEGAGSPRWARLFAADPVADRREKLAACPGLPADVVETLAADSEVRVVAELALWTTTPDVAARLAGHPHAEVRRAVAANEATPPAVLAALITGAGLPPMERCLVCDREQTPFVHDPCCARLDCDLPPGSSCDGSHESTVHVMRQVALQNPATPAEAVVGFADHPSALLRWALAARPDLPSQVYGRLATDTTPGVRGDLAENPAIDADLMRVLARDRDPDVRRRLAHHPHVPLDVLTDLSGVTKIGTTLLPRIAAASPAEVTDAICRPRSATRWPTTPTRKSSSPSPRTPDCPKRGCGPWSTGTASRSSPTWRPTRTRPRRCWRT